jgi:hypothetical protein
MDFSFDNSAQTNTVLSTTGTTYTYVNSNDSSAKQNLLDASTNLLGIGTSISAINYNNITLNKPTNFQADWGTTIINKPSTFPADMTTIYTKTETNNLLNAKEQILTFSSPLTRTTNTIGINLGSYSTSGNDPAYLLKIGTLSGALTVPNNTLGSGGKINSYDDYHYIQINQPTDTLTIQEYGTISFNIGQTKTQKAYINSSGLTVSGICSATTFSGSGASLTNIPYSALTGTPVVYTKTETDTLLNAKESTLTFSSPLTRAVNNITIDLSAYDTIALRNTALGSYLLSSTASSTYATITNLNTKQNNLTFSNPFLNTSNTITLKYNSAQFNIHQVI